MSTQDSPVPDELLVLRQKAEDVLATVSPSGKNGGGENTGSVSHELRVHQIELEMQNENLRELTFELAAARDRYADLYELAPVGYLTLDADWWIRKVNRAASILLGRDAHKLLGRPLSKFVAPESQDDFFLLKRVTYASAEPIERELVILRESSDRVWIVVHAVRGTSTEATEYRLTLADVTERTRAQEELAEYRRHLEKLVEARTFALTEALQEKETLLREMQHRVKNNLQFVSSLLSLEAGEQQSPRGKAAFLQSQLRVEAMALVHRLLHRSIAAGNVSSRTYVQELAAGLMDAYGVGQGRIALDLQIEDIPMTIDTAVPVGLIVNELLTNALTHAFAGAAKGTLRVALSRQDAHRYSLEVSDNGQGMPEEIDVGFPSTVGLTLVNRLAAQLAGSCECHRNGGTSIMVSFSDSAQRS